MVSENCVLASHGASSRCEAGSFLLRWITRETSMDLPAREVQAPRMPTRLKLCPRDTSRGLRRTTGKDMIRFHTCGRDRIVCRNCRGKGRDRYLALVP
jgi:hypothetical protein